MRPQDSLLLGSDPGPTDIYGPKLGFLTKIFVLSSNSLNLEGRSFDQAQLPGIIQRKDQPRFFDPLLITTGNIRQSERQSETTKCKVRHSRQIEIFVNHGVDFAGALLMEAF